MDLALFLLVFAGLIGVGFIYFALRRAKETAEMKRLRANAAMTDRPDALGSAADPAWGKDPIARPPSRRS